MVYGYYRKRFTQSSCSRAGSFACAIDTPIARIGIAICYDIEHEECVHETAALDASVILNPSCISNRNQATHQRFPDMLRSDHKTGEDGT